MTQWSSYRCDELLFLIPSRVLAIKERTISDTVRVSNSRERKRQTYWRNKQSISPWSAHSVGQDRLNDKSIEIRYALLNFQFNWTRSRVRVYAERTHSIYIPRSREFPGEKANRHVYASSRIVMTRIEKRRETGREKREIKGHCTESDVRTS